MKNNKERPKDYTCPHCKITYNIIGVIQKETHYYSYYIDTDQLEDFDGDESVESQKYFCLNCDKEVDYN